jgi:hypothetical protein
MFSTNGAIKRQIQGQITANGTTAVEFSVPVLDADSVILLSLNTVGGTPAGAPYVFAKNLTTKVISFKSVAGDTSIYDVLVFA